MCKPPNSVIHRNSSTTEVGFGRIIELILGLPLQKVNSFAMVYTNFAGRDTSPLKQFRLVITDCQTRTEFQFTKLLSEPQCLISRLLVCLLV